MVMFEDAAALAKAASDCHPEHGQATAGWRWMIHPATVVALALSLAACSPAPDTSGDAGTTITSAGASEPVVDNRVGSLPAPRQSPTAASIDEARYLGHWIGVEGLVLDVTRGDRPGSYQLAMQYSLDDKGKYTGRATDTPAPGIAFERDGERLLLRATDGDATGLKWLAGKKTCLTVKPSEGYCRD